MPLLQYQPGLLLLKYQDQIPTHKIARNVTVKMSPRQSIVKTAGIRLIDPDNDDLIQIVYSSNDKSINQ